MEESARYLRKNKTKKRQAVSNKKMDLGESDGRIQAIFKFHGKIIQFEQYIFR